MYPCTCLFKRKIYLASALGLPYLCFFRRSFSHLPFPAILAAVARLTKADGLSDISVRGSSKLVGAGRSVVLRGGAWAAVSCIFGGVRLGTSSFFLSITSTGFSA